jgi:hypothetical protein
MDKEDSDKAFDQTSAFFSMMENKVEKWILIEGTDLFAN